MKIQMSSDQQRARQHLIFKLEMMKRTDLSVVSRWQKLLIYKVAICLHLNWLLMIHEFPLIWLQKKLEPVATAYLKKWSGLAKPANTAAFKWWAEPTIPDLSLQELASFSTVPLTDLF